MGAADVQHDVEHGKEGQGVVVGLDIAGAVGVGGHRGHHVVTGQGELQAATGDRLVGEKLSADLAGRVVRRMNIDVETAGQQAHDLVLVEIPGRLDRAVGIAEIEEDRAGVVTEAGVDMGGSGIGEGVLAGQREDGLVGRQDTETGPVGIAAADRRHLGLGEELSGEIDVGVGRHGGDERDDDETQQGGQGAVRHGRVSFDFLKMVSSYLDVRACRRRRRHPNQRSVCSLRELWFSKDRAKGAGPPSACERSR